MIHQIKSLKKYKKYLLYSSKSILKREVAGSFLACLWWVLDPLFYMLVYSFVSMVIFKAKQEYYQIYIIIGVITWNFFNKSVITSCTLISRNSCILGRMYVPKIVFIVQNIFVNFIKLMISFLLIFVMLMIWRVPISFYILFVIPYLGLLVVIVFGISTLLMHIGVFIKDISNVMSILLRVVFYGSGIFYNIEKNVPEPLNKILMYGNPVYVVIEGLRNGLLYGKVCRINVMIVWFAIMIIVSVIGLFIVDKYENEYARVS